ncbi:MAG: hypothetical protein P9L94_11550 [Candidatus Hinthialibacter antarcticus]|nr:hypothetical protein [Candidatus Hinthialibacter antarcticus]
MLKPGSGFSSTPESDAVLRRSGRTTGVSWAGARAKRDGAVYQILLHVTIPRRIAVEVLFPGGAHEEASE